MRRLIAILLILAISVTAFSSCETKNTEEDPITLQGETGNGIASIEKTATEGLVDTYTITYTDGTTTTFTVTNGEDGIQGIQGEQGEDGHTPIITIVDGNWYIDGVDTGILAEGLKGDPGNGISAIELTATEGLVDTYTITYTDGTTTTFTVTNGAEGIQGIRGEKGEDGHTPIITIQNGNWYIDGVDTGVAAQGVKGDPGNGIALIEKTDTNGLVDTYTITYTDGTTTTFTVTNGAQGIQGIRGEKGEDGHTPVITIQNGNWYIDGVDTGVAAQGLKGDTGNGIASIDLTGRDGLIDTYTITYTDGGKDTFTVTNGAQGIQGIKGEKGDDGHTPVITIQNGNWHIDGVDTGVAAQGVKGDPGNGIALIEKTDTNGLVDTYTITYTDGTTTTFTVTNGAEGIQGIKGEKGDDGHTPVITIQNGNWHIDGVDTGVAAQGLKGDTGNGIASIDLTGRDGLIDTYTITYTDGGKDTFTVTNGAQGEQGIQGIQGEKGKDGHTPVITIENGTWHIDGTDTGVAAEGIKGDTGNGIASIEFTSKSGLVDTYTITYTDGTTTTFTVTNGAQGIQGIQGEKGDDGHSPIITIENGNWHVDGVDTGVAAQGIKGDTGNGISAIALTGRNGLVDTYTITYTDGTTTTFTVTNGAQGIQGIQGEKGEDGHTPVISIQNGNWHVDGVDTGVAAEGTKGDTGNGIASIEFTSKNGLVDTYTITYTDGTTTTFTVTNGAEGIQGIRGEKGEDGHTPVITIKNGNWHIDGVDTGVAAQGVKGDTGNGIASIDLTGRDGLIDTYTITYTDGGKDTFTVTNGAQGIQGVRGEKGEDGHTPIITIQNGNWHIDGVDTGVAAQGVKGDPGNGISSIAKTSTDGLVDTYTITYTNGGKDTFTVTNGAQGIQGIQGEKGEDGHTPAIGIVNGNWHIDGVDTGVAAQGVKGEDGKGIEKTEIIDGYLWITYTDGTSVNVGKLYNVYDGTEGLDFYLLPDGTYGVTAGKALYLDTIVIPAEYNGKAVTEILPNAFKGAPYLVSVQLPDSLTRIAENAFSGCSALTSIEIPASVTSIGASAFSDCASLASLEIPADIENIGENAFSGCAVRNAVIPSSAISDIPNTNLQTLVINSGTSIPAEAFKNWTALTSVKLLSNITSIGSYAFSGCTNLANIVFPEENTLERIEVGAFENCKSLSSITVPNSVTSIGSHAFYGCTKLESMTLPFVGTSETASAYYAVFGAIFGYTEYGGDSTPRYSERSYEYVNSVGGYSSSEGIWQYSCYSHFVPYRDYFTLAVFKYHIPSSLKSVTITKQTKLPLAAFNGCTMLESITLPSSVTSIGDYAFSECKNLVSVTLEEGSALQTIGYWAFSGCSSLTSIEIPASVTSIGSYAFSGCKNLASVTFEEGSALETIGTYAFQNCSSLTSIEIPASVTSIGTSAFMGCSSLVEMTLPFVGISENATAYNAVFGAIFGYESYAHKSSGAPSASASSTSFQNRKDSSSHTGVWQYSCYNHPVSTGVYVSNVLQYKYYLTCYYYYIPSSLKSVTITKQTELHDAAFNGCTMLENIALPSSVTSIGNYAFNNCTGLTEIVFEGTVAEWNAITEGTSWNASTGAYTVTCTDGTVAK